MPYGRRTYRRTRKPRSRTLSTRSIYLRKSATSQAKQIYALRRRVSRLNRRTRPDIKMSLTSPVNIFFNNSAIQLAYPNADAMVAAYSGSNSNILLRDLYRSWSWPPVGTGVGTEELQEKTLQTLSNYMPGVPPMAGVQSSIPDYNNPILYDASSSYDWVAKTLSGGTTNMTRVGDRIRLGNVSLRMTMQYATNLNNEEVSIGSNLIYDGATVRIIALQCKSQLTSNTTYNMGSILQFYATYGPDYDNLAVMPMTSNITTNFAVLCDRKYRLTTERPYVNAKVTIRPKYRTLNFRDNTGNQDGQSDHAILIYYIVTGLNYSTVTTEQVNINRSIKYTFTDL